MTTSPHKPRTAGALAWPAPALTWQERRLATRIADFLHRRRGTGRSDKAIRDQVRKIWPDTADRVLGAAELFYEARAEGWPET
jgi:hypothetical protein